MTSMSCFEPGWNSWSLKFMMCTSRSNFSRHPAFLQAEPLLSEWLFCWRNIDWCKNTYLVIISWLKDPTKRFWKISKRIAKFQILWWRWGLSNSLKLSHNFLLKWSENVINARKTDTFCEKSVQQEHWTVLKRWTNLLRILGENIISCSGMLTGVLSMRLPIGRCEYGCSRKTVTFFGLWMRSI